jgi:hypothetical protein
MKRLFSLFILSTIFFGAEIVHAQSDSSTAIITMKRDYPLLMQRYGDRIESQKAHYIFVVDVSSSMLPYETVVRNNFLQFLQAVPDGDQVSLIKMSDENNTGFVGLLKCVSLDPAVRNSIREVVNGFRFNRPGSPQDGSDGYSMAKCVLEAINVVGSNDLTFVYMLTDFEYWTHSNHFAKPAAAFASLVGKLPEGKLDGMCKYGIELNAGSNLNQAAIFKPELDKIFGKVEYQSVGSAALLSNWFTHVATGVMAVKLNRLLKEDWNKTIEQIQSEVVLDGNDVVLKVSGTNSPLIDGANVEFKSQENHINVIPASGSIPGDIKIGELCLDESKTILPGFISVGGSDSSVDIHLTSPYSEEISRLQGVCGEVAGQNGTVDFKLSQTEKLPELRTWNSILPLWAWIIIAVILLTILLSILYQNVLIHVDRDWSVAVKGTSPGGDTVRANGDAIKAPFKFGGNSEVDIRVKNAPWTIAIKGHRYNPLLFWKKSGYYATLLEGTFADVDCQDGSDPVTISVGQSCFLFKAGKSGFIRIHIHEKGGVDYRIDLN